MARIFLSHSSQDGVLTQAVADALSSQTPPFDVLVNTALLQAGVEWPAQLHAMMAYAHAGLLLFTRAAMSRPDWIRKEAYILTWRRSLDPNFKVFYAFFDDVTASDLTAQGFEPAHLPLLQRLAAKDPAAIAAEIRPLVAPLGPGQTPFETLASRLEINLTLTPQALALLAGDLGAPVLMPWLPGANTVQRLAAGILAGDFGSLKTLGGLFNHLKSINLGSAAMQNVLRWVAPHWIAFDAAARLAAVADDLRAGKPGGWAAVNGAHLPQYTAHMLVHKAKPFDFDYRIAEIEGPSNVADASHYSREICEWLRKTMGTAYSGSDSTIKAVLRADEPFLFVPLKTPDPATLRELRVQFPNVVFLLWTGPSLTAVDYSEAVIPLEPAVDAQRETLEYAQYRKALRALTG